MLFLQLIVCRSAVHCLKSQRVVLLSQDMQQEGAIDSLQECSSLFEEPKGSAASQDTQQEGAFACTHTLIVACTSPIHLLYWLGTCV
jgi:hypothetical protein